MSLQIAACQALQHLLSMAKPIPLGSAADPIVSGKCHTDLAKIRSGHCHTLKAASEFCQLSPPVSSPASARADEHAGLGNLLSKTSGEPRQAVLGALQSVLEQDGSIAGHWLPNVAPAMLTIWATNLHDPLLTLTLLDIFRALASCTANAALLHVSSPVCLI